MDYQVTTCADCGAELDGEHEAGCPERGRSTIQGGFVGQVLTMNERGITMQYEDDRAWQEQWNRVLKRLKILEDHYATGTWHYGGDEIVRGDVENFFLQCCHLGDWLWEDPAAGLSKNNVEKFMWRDADLDICIGVAETAKHRTLRNPTRLTAKVWAVTHNNDTCKTDATIRWTKGEATADVDALELARRCVAAWRGYLKNKKLRFTDALPAEHNPLDDGNSP